jgi:hypothetical protein
MYVSAIALLAANVANARTSVIQVCSAAISIFPAFSPGTNLNWVKRLYPARAFPISTSESGSVQELSSGKKTSERICT